MGNSDFPKVKVTEVVKESGKTFLLLCDKMMDLYYDPPLSDYEWLIVCMVNFDMGIFSKTTLHCHQALHKHRWW